MAKEMVGEEVNDIRFVINEDYRTKQGYHDSKVNPYLAPSFYFKNVEEYLNRFSKENVHIVIFEDLIANLDHEMSQIFSFFLNLENICVNSKIYNSYKKMRNTYLNKVIFNKQSAFLKTIIPRKIKYFLKNILYKKSEKPTLDKKIREKITYNF